VLGAVSEWCVVLSGSGVLCVLCVVR
jgi:hypothetical protein